MRIEVGYGLEGTLTDLHTKLIIENTMVPAFRAGDFSGGISRAVDDIIMVLEGNAAELEARGQRNPGNDSSADRLRTTSATLFIIIWVTLFFGGFAMAILPPIFGRKIGPGRYRWLGMDFNTTRSRLGGSSGGGWSSGGSAAAAGRPAAAAAASPAAADRPAAAAPRGAGDRMARAMTPEEHARIADAVQAAEASTAGEIYCVVARSSDSYFFPAAFMVTLAIVVISLAVAYLLDLWWYDLPPMTLVGAQLVAIACALLVLWASFRRSASISCRSQAALPPCARQCDEAVPEPQHPPHHRPHRRACCSCRWPSAMPKSSPTPASTAASRRKPGTASSPA